MTLAFEYLPQLVFVSANFGNNQPWQARLAGAVINRARSCGGWKLQLSTANQEDSAGRPHHSRISLSLVNLCLTHRSNLTIVAAGHRFPSEETGQFHSEN
jgi:hypothetical protein